MAGDAPERQQSSAGPLGVTLAGKFLVKRLIGKGGMGAVYEGTHVEIGKRVAIKLIEPEHARSQEIAQRFRQEARAASRVESDHIVQVFDVGQDDKWGLYMVMEYLTGEDLAKRIDREGHLDLESAIEIAYQSARGLAKAHAASVIHRDLKPANIFLSTRDDGSVTVKLVDFGISKIIAAEQGIDDPKRPITRWGSAVGTPQYMSPEQAQGQAIDHRTDVWALGACLYEMLCGKQAYQLLESYEQTIFAIVLKKPPPLEEMVPDLPPAIVSIVERALEKDLDLRIPDCSTFARMLAEAMPGGTTEDSVPRSRLGTRDKSSRIVPHKDAIVIVGNEDSQHDRSPMAATQPLAPALSPSSVQAAVIAAKREPPAPRVSKPTLRGVADPGSARSAGTSSSRSPAPTVSGVSVHTPVQRHLERSGLDSDIDYDVVPRKRRGGVLLALFVVALAATVVALGFIGPKRWPGSWPPWASWSAWGIGGDGPAPAPTKGPAPTQKPVAAATTPAVATTPSTASTAATTTTTSASTNASASASTKASASAKAPASLKIPGGKLPVPSVTAEPSATAPDQFGGTGVSKDY